MNNSEKAVEIFDSGYNCAQAVISVYHEKYKLDKETALYLTRGFGAGMALMQETCGAVSGAIMILGLDAGTKFSDISLSKEKTYAAVDEFVKLFKERNKTIKCRELLNVDLKTDEGMYTYDVNELHDNVCMKCIKDSVEIIDQLTETFLK